MSDETENGLGPEDNGRIDVAEYVLGLGDPAGREALARRIEADPGLAAEARFWESHFAAFNDSYAPKAPPAVILERIEEKLFPAEKKAPWYNSLFFWRAATGLAFAAALVAVGLNVFTPAPVTPEGELVATLAPVESDVQLVALYDEARGELRINGTGAPAGEGNDYELWFIVGENDPVSMGLTGVGVPHSIPVDPALRDLLAEGITLAVSRESAGGSATGLPQGPVVAAGVVQTI